MNEGYFRDRISSVGSEKSDNKGTVELNIKIGKDGIAVQLGSLDDDMDKSKATEMIYDFFHKQYIAFGVKTLNNMKANYKIIKDFLKQCGIDCVELLSMEDEDWHEIGITQHEL